LFLRCRSISHGGLRRIIYASPQHNWVQRNQLLQLIDNSTSPSCGTNSALIGALLSQK
jgi:hypothetical protein